MAGLWQKLTGKLVRSSEELDDQDLQDSAGRLGATPINKLADRSLVEVCGVLRSVTLPPRTSVPALVAEVYDGSAALNLVWLGRREIIGIVPGAYLRARGRVTYRRGVPTVFNPTYELLPPRAR